MDGINGPRPIGVVEMLARDYASFSQSRSGLGNVLGGVVGLLVFAIVWVFHPGPATATLALGLTVAWLAGKEALRRILYRRFGYARAVWEPGDRRRHARDVILLAAALLLFAAFIIFKGDAGHASARPYLAFSLVTPIVAWLALRTIPELLVGVGLLFIDAVALSGHQPAILTLLWVPAYCLVLICLGVAEHQRFQLLERRLGRTST